MYLNLYVSHYLGRISLQFRENYCEREAFGIAVNFTVSTFWIFCEFKLA